MDYYSKWNEVNCWRIRIFINSLIALSSASYKLKYLCFITWQKASSFQFGYSGLIEPTYMNHHDIMSHATTATTKLHKITKHKESHIWKLMLQVVTLSLINYFAGKWTSGMAFKWCNKNLFKAWSNELLWDHDKRNHEEMVTVLKK